MLDVLRQLFAIGFPPALQNEAELRDWTERLLFGLRSLAAITAPDADDRIIALMDRMIAEDVYWAAGYHLLLLVSHRLGDDFDGIAEEAAANILLHEGDAANAPASVLASSDATRFDNPVTIIAMIIKILEFIREWRKRT